MNHRELRLRVEDFIQVTKERLSALSRKTIEAWPEYPAIPPFSLDVPPELSSYKFTLMKDTFPDGRIRIAIQSYEYRFLGIGYMSADGFSLLPTGALCELTEEDLWDLT